MNTRMRKIVMAGALIAAASALGSQAADQGAASAGATEDQRITQAVESKLASEPRLSGIIGVETKDGLVTLKGRVATSGESDRAERIAESVEGVKEVDNQVAAEVGMN